MSNFTCGACKSEHDMSLLGKVCPNLTERTAFRSGNLADIVKFATAKAKAAPSYFITPKHATLIEYRLQQWVDSGWGDLGESRTALQGFSDLKKIQASMQREFPNRAYRIIAIGEVS